MTGRRALLIVGLLAFCTSAASSPQPVLGTPLKTAPCRVGQTRAAAICGTYTVFENRATRAGRTIALHFIVIKAKQPSNRAIAFNPGGPGVPATSLAADFADATTGAVAVLRDRYDILLLDNRGTGGSAPQQCDFAPAAHPELYFRQTWPDTLVRACRDRLAQHANLSLYSTSAAADDLNDVRAALGYPKLVLYGGSYGTMFYLAYARQHPAHVESMVLEGVAPPHFYIIPLPMARGAQTSIEHLESACRSDRTCSSHFPAFAQHFTELVQRFDRGPVAMTVENAATHRAQRVQLTKEVFVETVRHALYFPGGTAYMPVTVERAYHGDYVPLAQTVSQLALLFANLQANGLNLSVSCAEDIPFITKQAVKQYSAGTFEGDARVRAQQRACKFWNVAPVPASFVQPVHSTAPILMISGSDDPATPPQYAREALKYLPNARIMLVRGASHDSDYPPCVDRTIEAFVRAGSAAGLTFGNCATAYHRPSFATLAYDEAAPGENSSQSARFRKIIDGLLQGRIDRSQVTPAVSKEFSEQVLKGFSADTSALGALQKMTFKGAKHSAKGETYTYLLRFVQADAVATFIVNAAGRISYIDVSGQ